MRSCEQIYTEMSASRNFSEKQALRAYHWLVGNYRVNRGLAAAIFARKNFGSPQRRQDIGGK
jgi:hypothetical protein